MNQQLPPGQPPPGQPLEQGQQPAGQPPEQPTAPEQGQQPVPQNQQQEQSIEEGLVNDKNVKMSPAQEAQLEAYNDNATIIVFSEESQPGVLQSLQETKDPVKSVAKTANLIHHRLETSLQEQNGEKMTEVTMCLGAAHLVSELIVLADAAGLYTLDQNAKIEAFRQAVMMYFAAGLKDGSINPVELQKSIEPLMTDAQRKAGLQAMDQQGVLKTAPPSAAGKSQGILGGQNVV